ncbi:MAG: dihydrofolate reductase [Raineya sp.]|nr:dihydrofolate reductase [Raineya sp.]MDW8296354.1 dihydrofolate reductase [Raineya sp.]
MVSLIVAASENNVIGKDGKLPWRLKDDMQFFKKLTTSHVLIMGRKTFESLPKVLPNRVHIIVSRDKNYDVDDENCYVLNILDEAIDFARTFLGKEIFIIGGGTIYEQAIKKKVVKKIYLTRVKAILEGDTFFPEISPAEWKEVARYSYPQNENNQYPFDIIEYERID